MKNKYVCLNCGKEFLMTTRFQNGKDVGRKYCSNKCKRFMCGINYRYKFKTDIIKSYLNLLSVPEISEIENCPQWVIYNHFRRNKIKLRGTLSHSIIPELTITQQAYLAGIIDGEGCISLKMGGGKYWIVQVTNTDKGLIDYLCSLIPQSNFCTTKNYHPGRDKEKWSWRLNKQVSVLLFLQQIYPYLIIKKKRAEEAIKILKNKFNSQL